jgi:predicted dehydrogenase
VFDTLDAALERKPDAVWITNPSSLHVAPALAAVRAGAHVFIEKPLSDTLAGVEDLARELETRGLVGLVGYQQRFHPGFERLQACLASGQLGNVYGIQLHVGEYLPGFHTYEDYRRMYASRRDLGGGVTLSQIHEIDFIYALLGLPERVFSLGSKVSNLDIDVEDVASSLLQYRRNDGALVPVELHQDYLERPKRRYLRVMAAHGKVEWSLSEQRLTRWNDAGDVVESVDYASVRWNDPFLAELKHFLACVRSSERPRVDVRAGVASLRIALALRKSQETGALVSLAEVTT